MKIFSPNQSGFIALVSIVLIGALVLLLAIGISWRAMGILDDSFAEESSYRALSLAEACAEHAIHEIKLDAFYSGNEEISIANENCQVGSVEMSTSTQYSFSTGATVAEYSRNIAVNAEISASSTRIMSWENTLSY